VCEYLFEMMIVNKMLKLCEENPKKPHFNPFISIPGVKNDVNTVNMSKQPLYFYSRHEYSILKGNCEKINVNNKKYDRRGLGSQC